MSVKLFDVVVLGAGPAGIGSAMHLAEKGITVLLLEKEAIGTTQKTWLTFDHVIEKYDLEQCVKNRFSEVVFSSYLGNRHSFKRNDFIFPIDEEKTLLFLAEKAKNRGAVIRDREPFVNYSVNPHDHSIEVRTTKNTYRARLAVDAMGRYSPILKSFGLKNDILDMGCLAFLLKGVKEKRDDRMVLYDSFFPGSDYFWTVPFKDHRMMAGIFFFSPLTHANLKEKTKKLEFYLESKGIRGEIHDRRMGNIPLGGQDHVNTEHFLCIGDSCNTALPSSGFSFSRCLEESKGLADFALRYLSDGVAIRDYRKEVLKGKIPGIEVHLMISAMLSKFTDPMLDKAIGAMNELDEKFLVSFMTGRDMSVNFAITALRAILNTYSLAEIRSLSLQQASLKNIVSLYNILRALPQANIRDQMASFLRNLTRHKYPNIAK
jgi:flavin-dependent dehydrogenase